MSVPLGWITRFFRLSGGVLEARYALCRGGGFDLISRVVAVLGGTCGAVDLGAVAVFVVGGGDVDAALGGADEAVEQVVALTGLVALGAAWAGFTLGDGFEVAVGVIAVDDSGGVEIGAVGGGQLGGDQTIQHVLDWQTFDGSNSHVSTQFYLDGSFYVLYD